MYTASVTKRRKLVVAVAAAIVTLMVAAVVIVHSPGVQRRIWTSVTEGIEEASGVTLEAEGVRFRAFPASVVLGRLRVVM